MHRKSLISAQVNCEDCIKIIDFLYDVIHLSPNLLSPVDPISNCFAKCKRNEEPYSEAICETVPEKTN